MPDLLENLKTLPEVETKAQRLEQIALHTLSTLPAAVRILATNYLQLVQSLGDDDVDEILSRVEGIVHYVQHGHNQER